MNKKGFTLIEMLIVIILIGLVLVIAVPAVRNLTYGSSTKKYEQYEKVILEGAKLYTSSYRGELANDSSDCFTIPYSNLVKEGFLVEEDIHCSGSVVIRKRETTGYRYSLYLNCKDDKDKVVHKTSESIPNSCTVFSVE